VPRAAPNKQKLTQLAVAKLRPQARPFLVWDVLQRGLVLQVQPSGHRAFKVIYRFHNRPRWYHIGAADAIGLADARKLAAGIMLQVIQGVAPTTPNSTLDIDSNNTGSWTYHRYHCP
jgi:Arm DNA-binding domain